MERLIDADKLKAVLQNIKEHLEESGEPQGKGMSAVFAHTMEIVDMQPTIEPPPNDPLTLEELQGMDGCPVWLERHSHFDCTPHWALVHVHRSGDVYLTERNCGQILFIIGDKVYRRKPEEGTM